MENFLNKDNLVNGADRVWKMLDDMHQNDPEGYKKFISQNLEEGKKSMDTPQFWFSIHAKDKDTMEPIYINMCSLKKVPKPKNDYEGVNLYAGEGISDRSGEMVRKVEYLAANAQIFEDIGDDKEMRNMLVKHAVDYFNKQKKYNLSYSCGVSKKVVGMEDNIMMSFLPSFKKTKAPEPDVNLSEIKLPFQVSETPDIDLETPFNEQSNKENKKNLISEISSTANEANKVLFNISSTSAESGNTIVVKATLNCVDNISEVDLEICDQQLVLTIDDEMSYCQLPCAVDEDRISAKFSKLKLLTVTLPCI